MEIQIGEYVRTKDGHIGRYIQDAPVNNKVLEIDDNEIIFATEINNIAKHSFDLIELIEKNDYVNGELIDFVVKDKDGRTNFIIRDNILFFNKYNNITSIVTKEQFEAMEYKIKEN